jgi:hypothetical protein
MASSSAGGTEDDSREEMWHWELGGRSSWRRLKSNEMISTSNDDDDEGRKQKKRNKNWAVPTTKQIIWACHPGQQKHHSSLSTLFSLSLLSCVYIIMGGVQTSFRTRLSSLLILK